MTRKTGFRMGIESTAAPNAVRGSTPARFSETMVKLPDSDCRRTKRRVTRSEPSKKGKEKSERAGNDRGAMKEFTAGAFAEQYRVCEQTARRYLKALVKKGMATTVQKPFYMMSNGKRIELKRTVTTYRVEKGLIPYGPDRE